MPRKTNKQIKLVAEPDSHPTTPPRTQPHATSAIPETPATIGGGAPPGFEFEFQLENVDPTTGMMVEGHRMAWDEMTQESTALLLTLPDWFQAWFCTASKSMRTKCMKLETALAENEAQVQRLKKLAKEDGDYYHRLQVRLSNLEDEKSMWDLERKREQEDKAACVFKFQPAATQTETAVGQDKGGQTEVPQVQEGETQTPACTYASVAAQTEVKEKGAAKHTDSMDIDSTAPPSKVTADPPSAKDQNKDKGVAIAPTSRAFFVHGVACIGPMTHKIQEVERAFGGKGGGVIGV